MPNQYDLSDREIEILELLANGASNKEIAARLVISTNTVKVHLRNIYAKLDVNSRTEAAMSALRNNLVGVEGIQSNGADTLPSNAVDRSLTIQGLRDWSRNSRNIWVLTVLLTVMFLGMIIGMLLIIRGGTRVDPENPELERWQKMADLPTPRSGLATVVYANQVYAIGGETSTGVTGVMERYDPALDEWSILETKPLPVTDIKAAVIGERIYVPGGRLEAGDPTDVVEVYDPLLSKWDRISSLPTKLAGYALVAYEGRLFIFGGWDGATYTDAVYEYDPNVDQWIERTSMLSARGHAEAVVVGEGIYLMGGYDGDQVLSINEVYFPAREGGQSDVWEDRTPMLNPRHSFGAASIANLIHVIGGITEQDNFSALQYSPLRDEWQNSRVLESPAWSHMGLVPIETNLFVMGGVLGDNLTGQTYSYKAVYTILLPLVD